MIPFQVSISKGWLHDFGGFSFTVSYYFDPYHRRKADLLIDQYLLDTFKDLPIYNFESNLVQKDHVRPNFLRIGAIQPNLILGKILGANFIFPEAADADIDRSPLKHIKSAAELPSIDFLLENPIVKKFNNQLVSAKSDTSIIRIPPFFWDLSGRATIHGILTTGHKLVGEDFFLMMYDNPQLAHIILSWISNAYMALIQHYASMSDMTVTSVHIGECSGCLVSLEAFKEFAQRYIEVFGQKWPLRVHSCGFSDHLLASLTSIGNLCSLDVGSNTSVQRIRQTLGSKFLIEVAPPVEILLEGSKTEECIDWITTTVDENARGPMEIKCHLEPGYSLDHIRLIHQYIQIHGA
ncbi:MAG: uroporphyrinogen decarboxylase family protein [Sphaerochaetaceae bacterium]|jgi:hypothetical protein|nr:uroporphyrinogen decarboxylase family protein [Sphaerochaetaceae bacterium]